MTTVPIFLMPEEVEVLNGFKKYARQEAWRSIKGWRFELNGNRRPIISRRYAEMLLGCGGQQDHPAKPNFAALRAA